MAPTLTIGEVARQASINTSAIRYYERQGVLPEPDRFNGKRRYEPDVLQRLKIIEVAKKAGLSLDDVRTLFETTDAGAPAHAEIRALAQARLPQVEALIQHATEMKRWLEASSQCSCDSSTSVLFSIRAPVPAEITAHAATEEVTVTGRGPFGRSTPEGVGAWPRPHL